MTHSRSRFNHRPRHHGNIGAMLAQLAISIVGGIARNKMNEHAHRKQQQHQQGKKRR